MLNLYTIFSLCQTLKNSSQDFLFFWQNSLSGRVEKILLFSYYRGTSAGAYSETAGGGGVCDDRSQKCFGENFTVL